MKYMRLRSAHDHRFVYVVGLMALLKSWSSKLHSTPNFAPNLEVSQEIIIMSSGSYVLLLSYFSFAINKCCCCCCCCSIVFVMSGRLGHFGNFWHKSAQSSLEDQDKQQISFFVIRFTVKYSDWQVATTTLKVLDFRCLKVLRSVRLSLCLCKILVQFVRFMLFSGHLGICFT